MENKFFTFLNPYINYIDKGDFFRKPFSWLYALLAIVNLILPLYVIYNTYKMVSNPFSMMGMGDMSNMMEGMGEQMPEPSVPAKIWIALIIFAIFLLFAGWLCFQLWWNRMSKVLASSPEHAEFVATPSLSHFIQTVGESLGIQIAIVGVGATLSGLIAGGGMMGGVGMMNNLPGAGGLLGLIMIPIWGFLITVIARFIAEAMRALTSIANNTKK